MDVNELRQLTAQELTGKVRQWREDLFRHRFKRHTSEAKDTSIAPKLRRDIARALTVLNEKQSSIQDQSVESQKEVTNNV